jgi:uncharacterized protein
LEAYRINIQGLSNKIHQFELDLGDDFFNTYGTELVAAGNLNAKLTLDKRETFLEATFQIKGSVSLTCDRSLEIFLYPIELDRKIIFKYGHEDVEISEDVLMIQFDTVSLELGHLMYEFIGLSVPMKKLHPRFAQEDDQEGIVYSSEVEKDADEIDPRWEILKKLNKNK